MQLSAYQLTIVQATLRQQAEKTAKALEDPSITDENYRRTLKEYRDEVMDAAARCDSALKAKDYCAS